MTAIVDIKKESIFKNKNIMKSNSGNIDFPAFLGVEIVELEEVMLTILSLALT